MKYTPVVAILACFVWGVVAAMLGFHVFDNAHSTAVVIIPLLLLGITSSARHLD